MVTGLSISSSSSIFLIVQTYEAGLLIVLHKCKSNAFYPIQYLFCYPLFSALVTKFRQALIFSHPIPETSLNVIILIRIINNKLFYMVFISISSSEQNLLSNFKKNSLNQLFIIVIFENYAETNRGVGEQSDQVAPRIFWCSCVETRKAAPYCEKCTEANLYPYKAFITKITNGLHCAKNVQILIILP